MTWGRFTIVCTPEALPVVEEELRKITGHLWSFVDPHDDGETPSGHYQCSAQVPVELADRVILGVASIEGAKVGRGVVLGVEDIVGGVVVLDDPKEESPTISEATRVTTSYLLGKLRGARESTASKREKS